MPLVGTDFDDVLTRVKANLEETVFAAAWAEGRLMSLDQAVEYALSEG